MAVIASFTASPEIGLEPPSEAVQFTDTSTGSPDSWLWDFGDGTFSSKQNPLHVYSGSVGDVFTATLKAWINNGTAAISITHLIKETRGSQTKPSIPEALANWQSSSWISTPSGGWYIRVVENNDSDGWYYDGIRRTSRVAIPASPGGGGPSVYILEARRDNLGWAVNAGSLTSNIGGIVEASSDFTTWEGFIDLTQFEGSTKDISFYPVESVLPAPGASATAGVSGSFRVSEYQTNSEDDFDSTTGIISFGLPPVAAFSASPTSGGSPLIVQFTNLSTPAVGTPTNYIWEKRLSGSGDAFTQFSTDENPIEIFTK